MRAGAYHFCSAGTRSPAARPKGVFKFDTAGARKRAARGVCAGAPARTSARQCACHQYDASPRIPADRRQRKRATMTTMAPVAFEIDVKSPAPAAKTPVQKRLEQLSPKKSPSSPAIDEKLAKCDEARKVRLPSLRALWSPGAASLVPSALSHQEAGARGGGGFTPAGSRGLTCARTALAGRPRGARRQVPREEREDQGGPGAEERGVCRPLQQDCGEHQRAIGMCGMPCCLRVCWCVRIRMHP